MKYAKYGMVAYNLGAFLYRQKEYHNAIHYLEKVSQLVDLEDLLANGGTHPLIVMAYCEYKLGNVQACIKRLNNYRAEFPKEELLDVFILRTLCGKFKEAMSECAELLREWYATDYLCAMIAECINQSSEYQALQLDKYTHKMKKIMALVKDIKQRKTLIREDRYVPPLIKMYQFMEMDNG